MSQETERRIAEREKATRSAKSAPEKLPRRSTARALAREEQAEKK